MAEKTGSHKESEDTYSYKGWLNSDSFLKRAFAVYGYSTVAGLILAVPAMLVFLVIGLILAVIIR